MTRQEVARLQDLRQRVGRYVKTKDPAEERDIARSLTRDLWAEVLRLRDQIDSAKRS